jgi:DNA-binding NarL/FixJ family response regulator
MIARTEKELGFRPRLLLAYADTARAALSARHFRRMGWEVHQTFSGPEARRLVCALRPQVVVLETELRDESGWLTCAKLTLAKAPYRVVLVAPEVTPAALQFAELVGATALVSHSAGLPVLAEEVHETALAAAG